MDNDSPSCLKKCHLRLKKKENVLGQNNDDENNARK
jgi:hypothetical protein